MSGSQTSPVRAVLALAVLVAGTGLAGLAVRRPRWSIVAAAVAGAGTTAWLALNRPLEGPVLVSLAHGSGVTLADLLAVPALLLLVVLCVRSLRSPSPT